MDKTAYEHMVGMVLDKKANQSQPPSFGITPSDVWYNEFMDWYEAPHKTRPDPNTASALGWARMNRVHDMQNLFKKSIVTRPRSGLLFGPGLSPDKFDWHTSNIHNPIMRSIYDEATIARGNPPYIKDNNGNYAPAPGASYK